MKINSTPRQFGGTTGDIKTRSQKDETDKIQVSAASDVDLSRVQQLQGTLSNVPEIDAAKVSEIKQAISEGRFKVNPEKVADGLLDSVRQMLSSQPRQI